jgi:fructokinase
LARLLDGHARLVVVTNGAAPVRWHTREQRGEVASFRVATVDTTAAGDAFVGGLLYRLGEVGGDGRGFAPFCADAAAITDAIRFGAAVGALAVTRKGAFAAMPTLAEVQDLLQEHHAHA